MRKLPRIDLQAPPSVIGRNTVHAMQSGLLFGYASMVEGMVARFPRQFGGDMKVIATGGLAEVIAKETKVIDIIAPWLTLDGLRIIWEFGIKNKMKKKIFWITGILFLLACGSMQPIAYTPYEIFRASSYI